VPRGREDYGAMLAGASRRGTRPGQGAWPPVVRAMASTRGALSCLDGPLR